MNKSLFLLFFAVILFTSCNDDEVPQSSLRGTYEIAGQHAETGIWYVSQYIFKSDGSYQRIRMRRETDGKKMQGYTFYSEGNYSLSGENFFHGANKNGRGKLRGPSRWIYQ